MTRKLLALFAFAALAATAQVSSIPAASGGGGGGGAPTGAAGGSLSGTYPNPGIATPITNTFVGTSGTCYGQTYSASGSITAFTTVGVSGSSVVEGGTGGGGSIGVAQASVTNANPVSVCFTGPSSIVMDATAVQGNLAITSVTTGGDGHDSGQTSRNSVGLQVGVLGSITTGCTGAACTAVVTLEGMNRTGRQVLGAYLPVPSATTLGGIESLAASAHLWINQISTSGVPGTTQPACADLSNAGTACQAAAPVGAIVGTTDTQTLTNKTLDGVAPATMAYVDATSSVQTQLNAKALATNFIAGAGPLTGPAVAGTALIGLDVHNYGAKGDGIVNTDGAVSATPTYTFSCGSGCYIGVVVTDYSGVNTTTPIDVSGTANGTGTTITAPSVTTTAANDRLLTILGIGHNGTFTAPTPPPSVVQFVPYTVGLPNYGVWLGDQTISSAGATSTVAATYNTSIGWSAVSIGLKASGTIALFSSTIASTASATITVAAPSANVGDIQVACASYYSSQTMTPPSGWTLIQSVTSASQSQETSCWWKLISTANLGTILTSASATFTSGDVGKLTCVDGVGAAGVEGCGTITGFIDSHDVYVSPANANGALTGKEYAYATNDDTAIAAAVAAACGNTLYFPPGIYGATTEIDPCNNKAVMIVGAGPGISDYNYTGPYLGATPATAIWFLTKAATGVAAINFGHGQTTFLQANDAYRHGWGLMNIGIQAGLGSHQDGGGAGFAGVMLNYISHILLQSTFISGFGSHGVYLNNPWMFTMLNSFVQNNGGDGVYFPGGQNILIESTDISSNALYGVRVTSAEPVTLLNDLIQGNTSGDVTMSGGGPPPGTTYNSILMAGTYTGVAPPSVFGNQIFADPTYATTYYSNQAFIHANLGTPPSPSMVWCSDCTVAACATAGTGAWAVYNTGTAAWSCPF